MKRRGNFQIVSAFLALLFLALAFFHIPIFPWTSGTTHFARENACYANMRVILGALEMYNMDHSVLITRVDHETVEMFVATGYLKEYAPRCPEDRHPRSSNPWIQERLRMLSLNLNRPGRPWILYSYVPGGVYFGDNLASDGKLTCSEHGTVEE